MPKDSGAQIPMTAFGFQALKAELAELRARRPALVEEVSAARSQGDLSENFAYHDARQHLGMLDGRVQNGHRGDRREGRCAHRLDRRRA
ncbi:MAG: hypothetical protein E6I78_07365 [Chloroflexi bacterium]|nr:MAG: hypothetical protein E6I78_07365 [Chloroflexota bacterium]